MLTYYIQFATFGNTSGVTVFNRPFPSSKKSHFQNEAKCEAIDIEIILNYYANKTHFHNKGFALSLVLKVRFFETRKWPIMGKYFHLQGFYLLILYPVIDQQTEANYYLSKAIVYSSS